MWLFTPQAGIANPANLDRGLQFGDGIFETMLLQNGRVVSIARHLQRLKLSILRLALPEIADFETKLQGAISALQQAAGLQNGIVKLIYTRGAAGRGYLPINAEPCWYVTLNALTAAAPHQGLNIAIAETQVCMQKQMAGLKHLNRLENVLARMECESLGSDEVLMLNAFDQVIEASAHNVFFIIRGQLCTPELNLSGVSGIMRARVLDFCAQQGITCSGRVIQRDELADVTSMLLTNSINGPRQVAVFAGRSLQQDNQFDSIINAYQTGRLDE
ncbi:MAG: aminodeoxychorismate lyase [Oceanospirillaceae bacterium]|nr:aminodeoxychorismate lyase [Oceanospirillaceae bacterium]MCP5349416.1 aminodeoxychorismate lyase [Oceanospirillaceae bacterium]